LLDVRKTENIVITNNVDVMRGFELNFSKLRKEFKNVETLRSKK
jgi:hypothetical protein